jgi:predicted transposase/invertase (TIGR01784 family)
LKANFREGEGIMATIAEVWRKEGEREGKREGEREGRRKGKEEGKLEIARTMLVKGMEISLISEITGLKEDKISQNSSHGHNGSQ